MAKGNEIQSNDQSTSNTFVKGLNKDSDPSFIEKGQWTHARNAVNNTIEGNLGSISNESSNYLCAIAGDTLVGNNKLIVGHIHLFSDKQLIFTTSEAYPGMPAGKLYEIGLFEEDTCTYRIIVQDNCLNFNKHNLISGASREKEDCTWAVYFADGLNPDRYLNIGDPKNWPNKNYVWANNNQYTNGTSLIQWPGVQWIQTCEIDSLGGCNICEDTQDLDCDKLRLARLVKTPCLKVSVGTQGGTLRNGSYFAVIAYTIKQQKVTDYYSPSNVQPLFDEDDFRGGLNIEIETDSENFDEFELVVIQNINQGAVAKRIGIYSTKTKNVYLDQIKEDLISIDLNIIPLSTPIIEKSDQIVEVNNYLLRIGPTSKFDFNYQPLANLIQSRWASVEYPNEYYIKGGSNTSYLRDENYSFFIRWIYNTGDKSSSYHIPGRHPEYVPQYGLFENSVYVGNQNSLAADDLFFETFNTAQGLTYPGTVLSDGGTVVATGKMGYHQSTEIYPDNRPDIWNSSEYPWTGVNGPSINYDLCGLPIRHHKFPENSLNQFTPHFNSNVIRIMGVFFENIIYPKDNEGNDIPGLVGYEILRGSREGNKTIIAKGMLNNMRPYNVIGGNSLQDGLYPNYPFNTIKPVKYDDNGNLINNYNDPYIKVVNDSDDTMDISIADIPKEVITFHSPDTSFKKPLLAATELKLYGHLEGTSTQQFIEPNKHPEHKLLTNRTMWAAIVGGVIEAIIANLGKRTINQPGASFTRVFGDNYTQEAIGGGGGNSGSTGDFIAFTNGTMDALTGNDGTTEIVDYSKDYPGEDGVATVFDSNGLEDIYANALEQYFDNGTAVSEGLNSALNLPSGTKLVDIFSDFNLDAGQTPGGTYTAPEFATELSKNQYVKDNPLMSALMNNAGNLIYYFAEGFDVVVRLIYALVPYRQYALQMIGHGFYSRFIAPYEVTRKRFNIEDEFYLKDNFQDMREYNGIIPNTKYKINNLKRSSTVVLRTTGGKNRVLDGPRFIGGAAGDTADNSLVTLGTAIGDGEGLDFKDNNTREFNREIASHYAGIKVRIQNQYGQLETIKQIPATPCEQKFNYDDIPSTAINYPYTQKIINSTPVMFGGDTYINRYTEKNSMMFFYDWMYDQPDGYYFNYFLRKMIPQPRFWMNTTKYEATDLWTNLIGLLTGAPASGDGLLPSDYYQLDNRAYNYSNDDQGQQVISLIPPIINALFNTGQPGIFGVKQSFMYLAASGVRDFYVESDVIVDFRENGDEVYQKYYDPFGYTDLTAMFDMNPNVITRGNYFRYDYSLSISKLFTQYLSQGNLQTRNYDPYVSELCYTYYPDRIYYSLPQQIELSKDNWFVYLPNNYKEFESQISGVKNFAKTGIFITFKNDSPLIFQGTDTLQTDLGTKVTLGDGGLFTQTPQNVVVADAEYEYGSSQNKRSVISCPAGLFYISQNQGKIFSFSQGLKEISSTGLKWWFNKFLPYKLTEDFPLYPYTDNPVAGIGCHSTYDNENAMIYFAKKDYRLKPEFKGRVEYDESLDKFIVDGVTRLELGDDIIFEDSSWTISYDPKSNFWISHHDWHADLMISSKGNFLTTKGNGIWKHNDICNNYCNFYGVDYPFEIEIPITTGQTVTTMRSIQYMLECYKKEEYNCIDQFHVLDFNFDKSVIHNSEQVSGYLNLNPYPKNNVTLNLTYPIINSNSIDILYSKEENMYRFNQFWDITKDRGEFPVGSEYPTTNPVIPGTTVQFGGKEERNIWMTESNGYVKFLNDFNLNYSKEQLQRKKFRHYNNLLFLKKTVSGDTNMILKITNTKNQISQR